MQASDFEPHTRYVVTLLDPDDRPRPATLYVFRTYPAFLVARSGADGRLHRIGYERIERIVSRQPVATDRRYAVPAALLEESTWKDRASIDAYASGPHLGH